MRAAEESGFSHLWVYDGPRFAETWVTMTYCALRAPGVVVGTAVTNTETRDPTVTANAVATLSTLTGGRVVLGLGQGDSAVKFLGRRPAPFDIFVEKVRLLRALLQGERVIIDGKRLELAAPPASSVPLLISAGGPRTFKFAGDLCDGAILSVGGSPKVIRHAVARIREAATGAGRNADALYLCAWVHCAVALTRSEAIAELRAGASRAILRIAQSLPHELLGLERPLVSAPHRSRVIEGVGRQDREQGLAEELEAAIHDDVVRDLTLVGTPEDCVTRVEEIAAIEGLSHLAVTLYGRHRRQALELFRDVIIPVHGAPRGGLRDDSADHHAS